MQIGLSLNILFIAFKLLPINFFAFFFLSHSFVCFARILIKKLIY